MSCTVLMAAGAAAATLAGYNPDNPTDSFVAASVMPFWVRDITLVAIAVGAIAANALNVYSGAMSFLAVGIKIPFGLRRAIVALGLRRHRILRRSRRRSRMPAPATRTSCWSSPTGSRRGSASCSSTASCAAERRSRTSCPTRRKYRNWAGFIAFVVATAVSIWLFSDQTFYSGVIVKATTPDTKYAISAIGDLTAIVGFVLAGVLYFILFKAFKPKLGGPLATEPDLVVGIDAAEKVA